MAEHIYPKKINNKLYYYIQKTWREKLKPGKNGKTRGTGKSRVRTRSFYLGTAESIWERLNKTRKPVEVTHREFGFVTAVYQTAVEIGLVDLLKEYIPGFRYGVERWLYFMVPIINRLQHATSKERLGKWAASTVLPDLLEFDARRLNGDSFWYATDDVISEKELKNRRNEDPDLEKDLMVGLDDRVFQRIEQRLFSNLRDQLELSWEVLLYDTTNFFTYLEEPTPSKLAQTGHNKEGHHQCKQVGLAMCVEKEWGIPLFHRVYRGNSQDANTFAGIVEELIAQVQTGFNEIGNLALILDKGNNSEDNLARLHGRLKWIGSLVPSHHCDLLALPLTSYSGEWEEYKYYRCQREVMGIDCAVVLTYSAKLARKQRLSLENSIEKLKQQVKDKWSEYKRRPTSVRPGILSILKKSRYGKYLSVECEDGQPVFHLTDKFEEKAEHFGKNILFSSERDADSSWIITQYHSKYKVEDGFKLLKDPELIRWRPSRHWTDTKIRAFGFCCIMSLVLIKVMEYKAAKAGMRMSPAVLKEELSDLKEIVMVYDESTAETQISRRSSIQEKLWQLFNLSSVEETLIR